MLQDVREVLGAAFGRSIQAVTGTMNATGPMGKYAGQSEAKQERSQAFEI